MINISKLKMTFRPMSSSEIDLCIALIDDSFAKNIDITRNKYENKNRSQEPWNWFGENNLFFYVSTANNEIIGYVIWRNLLIVSHLHSFLVASNYQRKGIGSKMLYLYEKKALEINPRIALYTLHTYEETKYNHHFYQSNGYRPYKSNDEKEVKALHVWIENCKAHNDWPLKHKRILLYKLLKH